MFSQYISGARYLTAQSVLNQAPHQKIDKHHGKTIFTLRKKSGIIFDILM